MAYIATNGTIETDRLLLKNPAPEDAEVLFALFGDPDVMRDSMGWVRDLRGAELTEVAKVDRHYQELWVWTPRSSC